MEIPEDEFFKNYVKQCGHCNRNTLLHNECEFICSSCGYVDIKRRHSLSKSSRKRKQFLSIE